MGKLLRDCRYSAFDPYASTLPSASILRTCILFLYQTLNGGAAKLVLQHLRLLHARVYTQ